MLRPDRSRPLLRRDHFIDLSPLTTSPAFARMWIGSTLAGLGGQLTIVAIMLHMYELTESTFAVSMIAVAGLVPMIFAGLWEVNKELGPCATIVTTDAPPNIRDVHDRCPLILQKERMVKRLAPETSRDYALELCESYTGDMAIWECWSSSKDIIPSPPKPTTAAANYARCSRALGAA